MNPRDGTSEDASPQGTSKDKTSYNRSSRSIRFFGFRLRFGIRGKLIAIFVAIKVVPLILLCWLAWYEVAHLGQHVESRTGVLVDETRKLVRDVGKKAGDDSIRALDVKSREAIERLTTDTARQVADFLYQRDQQVLLASQIPPNETCYLQFLEPLKRNVQDHGKWVLEGDEWVPAVPPPPDRKRC